LYINVAALNDDELRQADPVLSIIGERQYEDWRQLRHWDVNSREIKEAIERFCRGVTSALQRSWLSPEDRKRQDEAASVRFAEAERKQQEAKAERQRALERAEEERRSREAEAKPSPTHHFIGNPEARIQEVPESRRSQTSIVIITAASLIALASLVTVAVKWNGSPTSQAELSPVATPDPTPDPAPQASTPGSFSGKTTASGRPVLKFD
jgi:hypothetical protein